ncbi:MAG: hypothetical protein CMJ78_13945 [Planctomycetaceae bacterium]|nr:hypothetical protein [Planctomycetaceae bacterium]
MRCRLLLALMIVSLGISPALACLWDMDTLLMELKRFPSALELITGKFRRHSPEFYQWRIQDRLPKHAEHPERLRYRDDLAVAYDKTGQSEKAIELALDTHGLKPDRYETLANLGTFYIHAGQFEKGIEYIDKAIAINPNAHFGREIYQRLLVQYLMEMKHEGKIKLPVYLPQRSPPYNSFAAFVLEQQNLKGADSDQQVEELKKAQKGVLGMMRFGKHDAPVLLEALGDLLVHSYEPDEDAKQLATRAYLKASYEAKDPEVQKVYRDRAVAAIQNQTDGSADTQLPLKDLEAEFKKELAEANKWYEELVADEKRWIAEGVDVDAKFREKYYEDPVLESAQVTDSINADQRGTSFLHRGISIAVFLLFAGTICAVVIFGKRFLSRRLKADSTNV